MVLLDALACPAAPLPVRAGRGAADWVADAARLVWPGDVVVLGSTRLSGRRVRPVVRLLPAARTRLASGGAPELERSTLVLWECWPRDLGGVPPPGRPVEIVGFVTEGRWRTVVGTAGQLAGYGPTLVVRRAVPSRVRLAEADYYGIAVVVLDEADQATVVLLGRVGPVAGAERTVALRHREETLFAQLIDEGYLA
jgi:hypothetical protein